MINYSLYSTPVGTLIIGEYHGEICLCDWFVAARSQVRERVSKAFDTELREKPTPAVNECITQLKEYFSGWRQAFDVPLLMVGSEFQKRVWRALSDIQYGTTDTYGHLALTIGSDAAVRAVASAARANALSILIPCHRLIGRGGRLTGYAGGLKSKQWLLQLEASVVAHELKNRTVSFLSDGLF